MLNNTMYSNFLYLLSNGFIIKSTGFFHGGSCHFVVLSVSLVKMTAVRGLLLCKKKVFNPKFVPIFRPQYFLVFQTNLKSHSMSTISWDYFHDCFCVLKIQNTGDPRLIQYHYCEFHYCDFSKYSRNIWLMHFLG